MAGGKSNRQVVKLVISLVELSVFWSHVVCPTSSFWLCMFSSSFSLCQPGIPGPGLVIGKSAPFLLMLRSGN
jgi:hypothetical protein